MVKKIKLFEAVEDLFAQPIEIYEGPIRKIYANEFTIVRDQLRVKKKDEIYKRGALFYRTDGKFVNIEKDCVLDTRDKALSRCNSVVRTKERKIIEMLTTPGQNPKDVNRYLEEVKNDSLSIYVEDNEIKYSHSMPAKEFKKIKGNNQKNKK